MKSNKSIRKKASDEYSKDLLQSGLVSDIDHIQDAVLKPVRLSVTMKELGLLLFESAEVRSGFSADLNEINIPVLFAKINGFDEDFESIYKKLKDSEKVDYLSSFYLLKREAYAPKLSDDVLSNFEESYNLAEIFEQANINYLSPQKKTYILSALLSVCSDIASFDQFKERSISDVVSAAIFGNDRLFKMLHHYELLSEPPKLFVDDSSKQPINFEVVVRLLMYHYLFFDVIILSKRAYSSIEEYFPADYYDEFRL